MLEIHRIKDISCTKYIFEKNTISSFFNVENKLKKIYIDVLKNKDFALIKWTEKYDKVKFTQKDILVSKEEIKQAKKVVSKNVADVFKKVKENLYLYHKNVFENIKKYSLLHREKNVIVGEKIIPLEKVGVYIPGGVANYPSTVFMTVLPAKVSGVKEIYVVTPPNKEGKVNPYTLYCCDMLGVDKIFKVGGPWSIFALACGTETIPKVDKIVGPGNIYVQVAKKMVQGEVAIDMLAGPSEVTVLADDSAQAKFVAFDLISQAEHGEDTKIYLITTSDKLAKETNIELKKQINILERSKFIKSAIKRGKIFLVESIEDGIKIANIIAPEHLQIQCKNPFKILNKIKNAGCVFVGNYSPVVIGDYIAGPSHVLPTSGAARFSSSLSCFDFIKRMSIISYNKKKLKEIENEISTLSGIEELPSHYLALKERL